MEMFRLRIARLLCSGHIVSITSNERLADTYPLSAEQNFTNQVKARRSGQTSPPVPKTLGNRSSSLSRASGLEQEPRATLGLIDPVFQQARGGNVAVFVAKAVDLAQVVCQLLVVIAQLGKHIHRRDEIGIIVQHALQAADVADRMQGGAADFSNTFGDRIRSGEDLIAVLVEKQVIVTKMRAGHVPMKVLCFQIERKHVGE